MTISIERAIAKCAEIDLTLHAEMYGALTRAAIMIQREAKREIGHYQPARGPFLAWAPLRPRTIREKTRLGYSPPDNPLLRTGKMRASIERAVKDVIPGELMEAEIGANGIVPVVQEAGSQTVPARHFLGSAAARREKEAVDLLSDALGLALGVRGSGSSTRIR